MSCLMFEDRKTCRFVLLHDVWGQYVALLRLLKGHWRNSLHTWALRLSKFVAVNPQHFQSVIVRESHFCSRRRKYIHVLYVALCLSSISNLFFPPRFLRRCPRCSPTSPLQNWSDVPKLCVAMKPYRTLHISIPLSSGEILFFFGPLLFITGTSQPLRGVFRPSASLSWGRSRK